MKKIIVSLILIIIISFPVATNVYAQTTINVVSIESLKAQLINYLQQMIIELTKQLSALIAKQQISSNQNQTQPTQVQQNQNISNTTTYSASTTQVVTENYLNVSCDGSCNLRNIFSGSANNIIGSYILKSPISEDINISEITIGIDPNFAQRLKNGIKLTIEAPERLDDFGKLVFIAGQGGELQDNGKFEEQWVKIYENNSKKIFAEIKYPEELIFNVQENEKNNFQIPADKNFKINVFANIVNIEPTLLGNGLGKCIEPLTFVNNDGQYCAGTISYKNATVLRSCKAVGKFTGKIYTCNPQNINGQTITIVQSS